MSEIVIATKIVDETPLTISFIQTDGYATAIANGFSFENIPTQAMMMVTEIAEFVNELNFESPLVKKEYRDLRYAEELGDVIIRTCSLAQSMNLDLTAAINQKLTTNKKRPYRHGKLF